MNINDKEYEIKVGKIKWGTLKSLEDDKSLKNAERTIKEALVPTPTQEEFDAFDFNTIQLLTNKIAEEIETNSSNLKKKHSI